jgi:hypothetical protein
MLTMRFPTKWEFRTTQPKVYFAGTWVINQDQGDARCKQSREDRKGKRSEDSESDTGAICSVREFVRHIKLFK